jgi:transketolase N-terminal domain/subunit
MPTRRELANVIRVLAMDAVQQANSGHPGAPMGMADMAEVLWREFLKHNPPIRAGGIATASCSRTATPRCCCIRCCT